MAMDEDDLIKTGMEVVLKPVTDVAENAIGVLGGDWLSEVRARHRKRLKDKTEDILKSRGARLDQDPSPSIIMPLLSKAQDEGRQELQDLWAKLLAAANDPNRRGLYRREFVEIVSQLEPIDILVLPQLDTGGDFQPNRVHFLSDRLGRGRDEISISMRNLYRLDLTTQENGFSASAPQLTPLGRQFLAAVG